MSRGARPWVLATLLLVVGGGTAQARSHVDLLWPLRDVWSVALRFIRVDRGCKVTDRDPDAAYIAFDCEADPKKPSRKGALELISVDVQGRPGVRAQLTLADDPSYIELHLLELLERKIRDERGPVAPPPRPPAADAGQ